MDERFKIRQKEILAECQFDEEMLEGMLDRLAVFAEPFKDALPHPSQGDKAQIYLSGLLSDLNRKNAEAIAYRHQLDRQQVQIFLGQADWDWGPLLEVLIKQVSEELGENDGIISFDPSGFPKKGTHSVGVKPQYCGRLGKIANGQIGVFMGYCSRQEQALIDTRLYLPSEWIQNRQLQEECGIPQSISHQLSWELAVDMLKENGPHLPHAWVTGDAEFGHPVGFRQALRALGEQYFLRVPSNTLIRDAHAPRIHSGSPGRPQEPRFQQAQTWAASLPEHAWTPLKVRDAEKGPLEIAIVKRRVRGKEDRRVGPEQVLVVIRTQEEDGSLKLDYHFSNAPFETPLKEFARVATGHQRIEQCLQRGKGQTGLADYQVRTWKGWYHHMILSLIATWVLVKETRAKKKTPPRLLRFAKSRRP